MGHCRDWIGMICDWHQHWTNTWKGAREHRCKESQFPCRFLLVHRHCHCRRRMNTLWWGPQQWPASTGKSYRIALDSPRSVYIEGKPKQARLENHSSNYLKTFLTVTSQWFMGTPMWLVVRTTWNSRRNGTGNWVAWLSATHPQWQCVYQVTRRCQPWSHVRLASPLQKNKWNSC